MAAASSSSSIDGGLFWYIGWRGTNCVPLHRSSCCWYNFVRGNCWGINLCECMRLYALCLIDLKARRQFIWLQSEIKNLSAPLSIVSHPTSQTILHISNCTCSETKEFIFPPLVIIHSAFFSHFYCCGCLLKIRSFRGHAWLIRK